MWVMGVITIGMSLMQMSAQQQASKLSAKMAGISRDISKQNEGIIQANNAEEQYRLKKNQSYVFGEAVARAAASGVLMDGSNSIYLADLRQSQQEELDWLRNTGNQAVRQEQIAGAMGYQSGMAMASQQKSAALGSLASAVGGAYGVYSGMRTPNSAPSSITASTNFSGGTGFTSTGDYTLGSSLSGNWWSR